MMVRSWRVDGEIVVENAAAVRSFRLWAFFSSGPAAGREQLTARAGWPGNLAKILIFRIPRCFGQEWRVPVEGGHG
ncbi:hypothetical protein [Azorhizobium caulinodans]|uniref:hypothetical protein n=1 Tax=Azorhizobium caulinodans TaxID=7 RepID=UPI0011D09A6D|nr:hypothetical protein [Azorhizobium caulinodans]